MCLCFSHGKKFSGGEKKKKYSEDLRGFGGKKKTILGRPSSTVVWAGGYSPPAAVAGPTPGL